MVPCSVRPGVLGAGEDDEAGLSPKLAAAARMSELGCNSLDIWNFVNLGQALGQIQY